MGPVQPGLAADQRHPERGRVGAFSRVRATPGGAVVEKATRWLSNGPPERDETPRRQRVLTGCGRRPARAVVEKATRRWLTVGTVMKSHGSVAATRKETAVGMEAPNHGTAMKTPLEPNGRLTAFGNQLIEVHLWLARSLPARRELDSYLDGHGERPRELRAHCLTFCSARAGITGGEDDGAFPVLARSFRAAPALEELARDHHMVTGILRPWKSCSAASGRRRSRVRPRRDGAGGAGRPGRPWSRIPSTRRSGLAALDPLSAPSWNGSRPDFC